MAVSIVGFANVEAEAASVALAIPSGWAEGDLAILFWGVSDYDITATMSGASGWTNVRRDFIRASEGATDESTGLFYKLLTASESTPTLGFDYGPDYVDMAMVVIRGIDTDSPIDATTTYFAAISTASPNQPDITTTVANAVLVIARTHEEDGSTSSTPPSNPSGFALQAGSHYQDIAVNLDAGSAGAKAINAWSLTGMGASADHQMYTLALRPIVAASTGGVAIGSTSIGAVYSGSTEISKIYAGSTLVFDSSA